MTNYRISHACRAFLSGNRVDPDWVTDWLAGTLPHYHPHSPTHLRLQGKLWGYPIGGGDNFNDAVLEIGPRSADVMLKVKRNSYWYREHRNHTADLIIFNRHLPDTLCLGLPRDRYTLSQILDHEADHFYVKSDPLVRSMRIARRLGRQAIVVTVLPIWAEANLEYSDAPDKRLD